MHFSKSVILGAVSAVCLCGSAKALSVYSNNFDSNSTTGFSTTAVATSTSNPIQTETSPNSTQIFLGELGNQTATLTLPGLAAHTSATVTFDLYIIRTMDGDGPAGGGADPWSLDENGNSLINTSFANYPFDVQSFGGANGSNGYLVGPINTTGSVGTYAPGTGATAINTLGFNAGIPINDSIYHLTFTFPDNSSTLAFHFVGGQNQSLSDESWGLDNVTVTTAGVPEPTIAALLAPIGLLARRRRRSIAVTPR